MKININDIKFVIICKEKEEITVVFKDGKETIMNWPQNELISQLPKEMVRYDDEPLALFAKLMSGNNLSPNDKSKLSHYLNTLEEVITSMKQEIGNNEYEN